MKLPRLFFVVFPFMFIAMMSALLLIFSGCCIGYYGFALDRAGNLYLGCEENIRVYSPDGAKLRTISAHTSRGYSFTIENEEVIISTGSNLYTLDLYGKELAHMPIDDYEDEPKISQYKFIDENGTAYKIKPLQFITRIYRCEKDGDVCIFVMPVLDLLAKTLFVLALISMCIFIPIIIYQSWKMKR